MNVVTNMIYGGFISFFYRGIKCEILEEVYAISEFRLYVSEEIAKCYNKVLGKWTQCDIVNYIKINMAKQDTSEFKELLKSAVRIIDMILENHRIILPLTESKVVISDNQSEFHFKFPMLMWNIMQLLMAV